MKIDSAMNSALLGIQKGLGGMERDAAQVASAGTSNGGDPATDLTQAMVELQSNRLQVEAAAKVMKAADETLGSIIDILA